MRGLFKSIVSPPLTLLLPFCVPDMKLGMMDVGIFCKEPRFGINTEKGKSSTCKMSSAAFTSQHTLLTLPPFVPSDCSITKFLNRILGLEVHKQNHLFQYFTDNFDYLIEKDKKEGKYDMGILGTEPTKQLSV